MLPKRERWLVYLAVAAVVLLILDQLILTPMLKSRADAIDKAEMISKDLANAEKLSAYLPRMRDRWNTIRSQLPKQADDAEAQLLHNVEEWARLSGLTVNSLKPDRGKQGEFQKVIIHTTGTGSMVNVCRFLWRLRIAPGLVRVGEMSVDTRKDGVDDVTMTCAISTLCQAEEVKTKPVPTANPNPEPETMQ